MHYLAYGSNMLSRRLRERTPSCRAVGVWQLPGWQLRFHKRSVDGSGKCNILRSEDADAVVHGVVYEIDASERPDLDRVEGVGAGYRREEMRFRLGAESYGVFTYVAQASYIDDSLIPYRWYRDFVVAGAREHGLPEAYLRRLLEVPVRADPDLERAAENRRLLGTDAGISEPSRNPPPGG